MNLAISRQMERIEAFAQIADATKRLMQLEWDTLEELRREEKNG